MFKIETHWNQELTDILNSCTSDTGEIIIKLESISKIAPTALSRKAARESVKIVRTIAASITDGLAAERWQFIYDRLTDYVLIPELLDFLRQLLAHVHSIYCMDVPNK